MNCHQIANRVIRPAVGTDHPSRSPPHIWPTRLISTDSQKRELRHPASGAQPTSFCQVGRFLSAVSVPRSPDFAPWRIRTAAFMKRQKSPVVRVGSTPNSIEALSLQTFYGDRSRPMGRGPQGLFPASFVLTMGLAVYGKSIVINQLLVGSQ